MKTLEEKIAVMQAASEGQEIEFRECESEPWDAATGRGVELGWDWRRFDYRVKPREPQVLYVNVYAGREVSAAYPTLGEARKRFNTTTLGRTKRFVEDMDWDGKDER